MRFGFFGDSKKVSGVTTPHLLGLAACLQTIECVFTDDFQHPKAHLAVGLRFCHKQALINQRGNPVQHFDHRFGSRMLDNGRRLANDSFGCFERETSGEDRQPAKQLLLAVRQQLIAPLHGAVDGPLTGGQVKRSARQQLQPAI